MGEAAKDQEINQNKTAEITTLNFALSEKETELASANSELESEKAKNRLASEEIKRLMGEAEQDQEIIQNKTAEITNLTFVESRLESNVKKE